MFPVEKFRKITKFQRNQQKADQLLWVCIFLNCAAYKEHFAALLFDDMRARLTQNIQDELRGWARDMLPAELTMDIGHEDYVCCSFQILSHT